MALKKAERKERLMKMVRLLNRGDIKQLEQELYAFTRDDVGVFFFTKPKGFDDDE